MSLSNSSGTIRGSGFTPSERYLASLADKAFLRLWSYPNTFIDRKQNGKGDGKEFIDLTVVFDNDVLLFSDKYIEWPGVADINLAWSRWYRRAVEGSVKQINGAARWLEENEGRLFLDPACSVPFPVPIPKSNDRRIHGIAIASGATEACKGFFSDESGTFPIMPSVSGPAHVDSTNPQYLPFSIGDVNPGKVFVHVFDRSAIDVVLSELDTIQDFVEYLQKRSEFLRSGTLAMAAGEEELLALYLQSSSDTEQRSFLPTRLAAEASDASIVIPSGEYQNLQNRPEYLRKIEADKVSYFWDRLIENFIEHVLAGTAVTILDIDPEIHLAERALRIMAGENRLYRRALGHSISDAMTRAEFAKSPRYVRNILPLPGAKERRVGYVFLILAYPGDEAVPEGYRQYRQVRATMLEAYCFNLFEMRSDLEFVVGVGIDASPEVTGRAGGSEDLMAMVKPEWDDELRKRLKDSREHFGFLAKEKLEEVRFSDFEYPDEQSKKLTRQQKRAADREARKRAR